MIKSVLFEGNILTIIFDMEEDRMINVGARILKIVFTDTRIVVLLNWTDLNDGEYHNRNIICLNDQGQQLWRIVNQDMLSLSKEKTYYSWSLLEFKNTNCVRVGTTLGMEVDVDINTGEFISDWQFTK